MSNELTINQIGGLYNQLYNIEEYLSPNIADKDFLNMNALFWSDIFNIENVEKMIEELCVRDDIYSTKLQAIKCNPKIFMKSFSEAIQNIKYQHLDSQTCFRYLETLQIVCYLHTFLYSLPFELTIYEGYRHDQFSAKQLKKNSIQNHCNPYYSFIKDRVFQKIDFSDLKIVWLKGRPNISSFCIASLIKQKYPDIIIVSISNNSEFFSFSKIIPLLKHNRDLFSVFDCIVLDDNSNTYMKIKNCVAEGSSLSNVSNIIFTPDKGKSIICTKNSKVSTPEIIVSQDEIAMNKTINIKLFPENKCYWNKCSFCGINHKYLNCHDLWDISYPKSGLKVLSQHGIDKFWAIDEAIPPRKLNELCDLLKKENLSFLWHVRTRIEKEILLNNLPKKLSQCGLKHILFGFESASYRILKLMNKTNDWNTYTELSEQIVKIFNDYKIHVHFPIIIGFPTETQRERNQTFKFIDYLYNKYPYFSYNINILNLDVSSDLYSNWADYNISSIKYPCEPHDFIGNSVIWESQTNYTDISLLKLQAEKQMKKQFSWYPNDALLDVTSFYAMWEYSRSQLNLDKKEEVSDIKTIFLTNQKFSLSKWVALFKDDEDLYCLYNMLNHHCIRGGQVISDLVNEIKINSNIERLFTGGEKPQNSPVYALVIDLLKHRFIQCLD